jgi:hypothetical protein
LGGFELGAARFVVLGTTFCGQTCALRSRFLLSALDGKGYVTAFLLLCSHYVLAFLRIMASKTLVVVLCIAVEDEVTAVELEEIVKS